MPIIFRCKLCNQRMGIARRKVGMEVECPSCKGKVIVPDRDEDAALPAAPAPSAPAPFEQSDFEDFLHLGEQPEQALIRTPLGPLKAAAQASPQPRQLKLPSGFDVDPKSGTREAPLGSSPPGIVLSPVWATLLTVAVILALALAFSAGLFVGSHL